MARQRKGRDISGWLIIDKPIGITSAALVNKAKWALGAKKAGHAGTLDPEATGLLALAFGEATKTVPYITDALKAYEFTVRLGQETNTDDGEGEPTRQSDARPSDADIKNALLSFIGDIEQVPPKFSAVKIDGQRAYKLARSGADIALEARPLFVDSLLLIDRPDADHVVLELTCGKGGYVRAIARDLGQKLGCFGHVVQLRRIWSGPFDLDQAVSIEQLEALAKTPELDHKLVPLEAGLSDVSEARCTAESAAKLRNGNPGLVIAQNLQYGDLCWASFEGEAVAIGRYQAGMLYPNRVFLPTR